MYEKFMENREGSRHPVAFDLDAVMAYRPVGGGTELTEVLLGGGGVRIVVCVPFRQFDELMEDYNAPPPDSDEDDNESDDGEGWKPVYGDGDPWRNN